MLKMSKRSRYSALTVIDVLISSVLQKVVQVRRLYQHFGEGVICPLALQREAPAHLLTCRLTSGARPTRLLSRAAAWGRGSGGPTWLSRLGSRSRVNMPIRPTHILPPHLQSAMYGLIRDLRGDFACISRYKI